MGLSLSLYMHNLVKLMVLISFILMGPFVYIIGVPWFSNPVVSLQIFHASLALGQSSNMCVMSSGSISFCCCSCMKLSIAKLHFKRKKKFQMHTSNEMNNPQILDLKLSLTGIIWGGIV